MKRGANQHRLCRLCVGLVSLSTCAALTLERPAGATETQWWSSNSPSDYAKAVSHGVVVAPDGALELGPSAAVSLSDSLGVVWAVVVLKDGSVAIAGDRGRIDRWTEANGIRPWVKLAAGQVLSLAPDGDGLIAGTAPDGRVYRIGAGGDTALFARTGERYVWGLSPAGNGAWFAATGTRGRLLKLLPARPPVLLIDTDESNLVSMISDRRGGVFVGGDSKGRIVHYGADGTIHTVYDATEDEVKAMALGPDGALYAAALTAAAVSEDDGEDAEKPAPVKSVVASGHSTVYRIVPDSSAFAYWSSPQPFIFALVADRTGVIAATGNRAGLFHLEHVNGASQWLTVPQGQITALAVDARGRLFAATSNPGALWRLGPERAEGGELLSGALDAKRFAHFGRLRFSATRGARAEFSTRSGNTDPPDTTWSAWRATVGEGDGARILSSPARYLQWKLALSGDHSRVETIEISYREQNLAPRIDDLVVTPQGQQLREGEMVPHSEAVTQTMPGGQKVEYSIQTSAQKTLRDLPVWARGLRTIQWRASDPNGDALRYRVEVRTEPVGPWIEVGKELEASSFTWDTGPLPDGRYRVRVTASDAPGNPIGEALTGEALSEPFTIDNTPPVVSAFEAQAEPGAVVVSGHAEDATSVITRLEISLDDDDWHTVSPDDGLADRRELGFRTRLPSVAAGEHTVSVRAVDMAGNTATRATRITVPRGR